jgi:L-asparaginase
MTNDIRIFITGGTFDKEYNDITGELFFKDSHVQHMLKRGRLRLTAQIRTLMMMDSREMTETDRMNIVQNCLKADEDRIVITHGTDTMEETARVLAQHVKNKTVVLTGAMIPFTFGSSDGMFNLGSAIAFAQTLPPGVYIAMNGRYFHAENVRKNKQIGEFEEIKSSSPPRVE